MIAQPYWDWPGLDQLYLEDSYVLGIEEEPGTLRFQLEFVLREGHPAFQSPGPDEEYCYRRGELRFVGVTDVVWNERRDVVSWDARGERDMGNIDVLYLEDGWYRAEGDWGSIKLHADRVEAEIPPKEPRE